MFPLTASGLLLLNRPAGGWLRLLGFGPGEKGRITIFVGGSMRDLAAATCHRSDIIRSLEHRYPRLEEHAALQAVVEAVRALTTVGLDDDEDADRLVATLAERRVRQRLGLDAMDARLDPQPRSGRARGAAAAETRSFQ
jgi:hypothetical protein